MDSLESRLERLTPEQRKSVEDYVDFLLYRSSRQGGENPVPAEPSYTSIAPPPLLPVQESHEESPVMIKPTGFSGQTPPQPDSPEPEVPFIREIAPVKEDFLTANYMDYGKFETPQKSPPSPSPADEAVQRVKVRLDGKKARNPARDVLDWIE